MSVQKEKSREELIEEIKALRAQLVAFESGENCWDIAGRTESPCVAQQRLAGILTISDDAIISVDADHCITLFNQGAERIFQYRTDEVLGKPVHMLLPERYREMHVENFESFCRDGGESGAQGIRRELSGLRKDGTEFTAEASISRLAIGEQIVLTIILRDITERKRVEEALAQARDQALEASRIKSAFLANMSHEIRTPMNGVIGMIELLLDTPLNDVQREYAEIIHDSAQSLLTIINDILDYSKIEAGKLDLEIIDFEPLAVVEGVAELLASKARAKGLSLMTYVDPDVPVTLRGDPVRLKQILLNLGDNAIKFTDEGEVVIKASLAGREKDHAVVHFSVRDTGIGLTKEVRQSLFEPFVQADGSTTRKFGGTGLGLSISKRLVDRMGGQIGVESSPGEGALFWFRVPLECDHDEMARADILPDLKDVKVLVVDDNETAREILSRYLDSWHICNKAVSSGDEALHVLREAAVDGDPFDIAIVDLRMPDTDGIELGQRISQDQTLENVHLILLTAFDAHGQGEEALRLGFSAYMTKPVRQSHLFDCMVSILDKRQSASNQQLATPEPPRQNSVKLARKKILLAEDNPVNQRVVILQLERLGYPVDAVSTGQEAVEAVATGEYDLVLMDVQMPERDGFQATEAIRKAESTKGKRIPIVALTANAMQGDRERCLGAGMDDYVSKPVSPHDLRRVLEQWLNPSGSRPGTDEESVAINENGAGETQPDEAQPTLLAAVEGENAPLDIDALVSAYGPDPKIVVRLLSVFASSTPPLIERLSEGILARWSEESQAMAHELKGSSNMIGAHEMGELSLRIEEAVRAKDWAAASDALELLLDAHKRVQAFIHKLSASTSAK